MIILRPVGLRWIGGVADDSLDLCAHGDFEFRIGTDTLSDGLLGRQLTVSAAALYLLRTLQRPHKLYPAEEHLFPCCGFNMLVTDNRDEVLIFGCPNGQDFEVAHQDSRAGVSIRSMSECVGTWPVGWQDWQEAVFTFADRVSEFYASALPKRPSSDSEPGFRQFLAEWERRRGLPLGAGKREG